MHACVCVMNMHTILDKFIFTLLFCFQTIKAFVPDMISKNHGHIITIASGAGHFGVAGLVDYCSSKFGAVGTHLSLSQELDTIGSTGVKTTCICPYFINTGMFEGVKTRYAQCMCDVHCTWNLSDVATIGKELFMYACRLSLISYL